MRLITLTSNYWFWGFVILLWICVCQRLSRIRSRDENEGNDDEEPYSTEIDTPETDTQRREIRKELILRTLITKKIGVEKDVELGLCQDDARETSKDQSVSLRKSGSKNTSSINKVSTKEELVQRQSDNVSRTSSLSEISTGKRISDSIEEQTNRHICIIKPPSEKESPDKDDDQNDVTPSENVCSICLSEYKHNQSICYSPNKQCTHFFHKDCIVEWLLNDDGCPCCRRDFLG